MQIRWLLAALEDVESFYNFILEESEEAAAKQVSRIRKQVEQLAHFPERGRAGRVDGTRELVISATPFIVVYDLRGDTVNILAVVHGSRRWPRNLKH